MASSVPSMLRDKRVIYFALGAVAVAAAALSLAYFVGARSEPAGEAADEEEEEEDEAPSVLAPARGAAAAAAAAGSGSGGGVGSVGGSVVGGATVSARAFAAMLREMADALEAFQAEMTPKAEAHMASEAGFEAYQRAVTEGITRINDRVERAHGLDKAGAARAQAAHGDHPEVRAQMARVRRVIFGDDGDDEAAGGGAPVDVDAIEVPPGMTVDAFFALFCKHVAVVEAGYAEVIEEAQRSVKDRGLDAQALETYLKLLLQRKMPDMLAKAQAAVGLDEDVFRNCLMKWQSDGRFLERIQQSQMRQQSLLSSITE